MKCLQFLDTTHLIQRKFNLYILRTDPVKRSCPGKGQEGFDEGTLEEDVQLVVADLGHLLLERRLPGVQLQDLCASIIMRI